MKRLNRSRKNSIIGGVCGGLGDYFGLDPVLIRIVWLILIVFGGMGLLLYLIAWIIIPLQIPEEIAMAKAKDKEEDTGAGRFWWGLVLMVIGVILWGSQYNLVHWPVIPGIRYYSRDLVPLAMVLIGIYILYNFGHQPQGAELVSGRRLFRSRDDQKVAGVCAGIADYFNVDPTLIRVLWVVGCFFYGVTVLLYITLLFILPYKAAEEA